jgi:hypothetical protein
MPQLLLAGLLAAPAWLLIRGAVRRREKNKVLIPLAHYSDNVQSHTSLHPAKYIVSSIERNDRRRLSNRKYPFIVSQSISRIYRLSLSGGDGGNPSLSR